MRLFRSMQCQLKLPNGNYFETDFNHVVLYNSDLARYEIETMEEVVKDRDKNGHNKEWIVADMFYHRSEAVDYIEKNR